jgi:proteinaceous RNase P
MNADSGDTAAAAKEVVVSVKKKKRKEYRESPAGLFQLNLDQCSKKGATVRALDLYDSALAAGIPITLRHYNSLLYLCSLPPSSDVTSQSAGICNRNGDSGSDVTSKDAEGKFNDPEVSKMAVERGFEIYRRMCEDSDVEPNEATFTSMARLAAVKGDPHLAFDLVKEMMKKGMPPKLRSYWPALHGFCDALDVEMAHEVETHMDAHGLLFLLVFHVSLYPN